MIDFNNLQSLMLSPYACHNSVHIFLKFSDLKGSRAFLSAISSRISYGKFPVEPPYLNIFFTSQGINVLRPEWQQDNFESSFVEGPDPTHLGDSSKSSSAEKNWWERQFSTNQIHCIIAIYSDSKEALESSITTVVSQAKSNGIEELMPRSNGTRLYGNALSGNRLHFGYVDGLSKISISWENRSPQPPLQSFKHFVLGYGDSDVQSFPMSNQLADEIRDSSYVILRWIYQDVALFNRYLSRAASESFPDLEHTYAVEFIAAKLMGRWRDGTPLTLSPNEPNAQQALAEFDYSDDVNGFKCPFSSHIRVVNPRDQPLDPIAAFQGTPKLLRRGMSYGPELAGEIDDGIDRGIIGMFICSNIRFQFYTLMKWMNHNTFSPVFNGDWKAQDGITGNRLTVGGSSTFKIPTAGGDRRLFGLPDFLTTKGTAFGLMTSRTALSALIS